jgi:hypothetical protein
MTLKVVNGYQELYDSLHIIIIVLFIIVLQKIAKLVLNWEVISNNDLNRKRKTEYQIKLSIQNQFS